MTPVYNSSLTDIAVSLDDLGLDSSEDWAYAGYMKGNNGYMHKFCVREKRQVKRLLKAAKKQGLMFVCYRVDIKLRKECEIS